MKKLVSTLTLAGLLAVGTAGVAAAQSDPTAPPAATGENARPRHRVVRHAAKIAADTIGISTDELKQAVKDGKTIAQVAEEHGVSASSVVDAIVEARTAKIRERAQKLVDHQFGAE